jgi:hypothetical protein
MGNPKSTEDRINAIIDGWEEHAADVTFGGLSLAQFKAKVKPSLDARAEVKDLDQKLAAARVERNNSDVLSDEITNNVVNSVKGDQAHGENSALYASFGYIRKADRKSGLTRSTTIPAQPELKIAA